MLILHQSKIILTGNRNYSDGLWDVLCHKDGPAGSKKSPLQSNAINVLTARDKNSHELANFLLACAGIRTFGSRMQECPIDKSNIRYFLHS